MESHTRMIKDYIRDPDFPLVVRKESDQDVMEMHRHKFQELVIVSSGNGLRKIMLFLGLLLYCLVLLFILQDLQLLVLLFRNRKPIATRRLISWNCTTSSLNRKIYPCSIMIWRIFPDTTPFLPYFKGSFG